MMCKRTPYWLMFLLLLTPASVAGQGLLVDTRPDRQFRLPRPEILPSPRPQPVPHSAYKIEEIAVNAKLADQVAAVQLSQTFVNTGKQQMEVCFVFPLPYDGAISQLTLMVDGKEHEAKLLPADEARRIYQSYVRQTRDPALMEWIGAGMFQTSIFPVPPGAQRQVTLRYTQLCRKHDGLTELLFPLSTAKYTSHPVDKVSIRIHVESQTGIKNIYSPTHELEIQRPDERRAVVTYSKRGEVPSNDFRLFCDVADQNVGASVLSYRRDPNDDGYFLLLVSPDVQKRSTDVSQKTVVFVVDRSGSMSGKKMEQAKGALRFVLNNLRDGDLFNIVAYDSAVESFRPELQSLSDTTRKEAIAFVEGLYAGGSTNIDAALKSALQQIGDSNRPSYVIFLTDGLPTVGEKKEAQIAQNAKSANKNRARMFAFGVGYDVNSRLLDRLARENFGQSHYVRPDEDIEEHVSRLYQRIGSPVMTDVAIRVDLEDSPAEHGSAVNRVYPQQIHDLFAGEQLVLLGRYKKGGSAKVTVSGTVGEQKTSMDFPAKLVDDSGDDTHAFIEKLWAVRRVGQIIDEIDLHGKNQELIDELVELSRRHGILTPYTAFLAEEEVRLGDVAVARRAAGPALDGLQRAEGQFGFEQRRLKSVYQQAITAPASSLATTADVASGDEKTVATVRNVAAKTFFLRDGRWIDSTLTEQEASSARRVERYSPEYFQLIDKHGSHVGKYLSLEGEVTVQLDGVAYAF